MFENLACEGSAASGAREGCSRRTVPADGLGGEGVGCAVAWCGSVLPLVWWLAQTDVFVSWQRMKLDLEQRLRWFV